MQPQPPDPSPVPPNVIDLAARRPRPPVDTAAVMRRYVQAQLRTMRVMLDGGDLCDGSPEHRYVMARLDELGRVIDAWSDRLCRHGGH